MGLSISIRCEEIACAHVGNGRVPIHRFAGDHLALTYTPRQDQGSSELTRSTHRIQQLRMHPSPGPATLLPNPIRDLAQLRPYHDRPLAHRARQLVQYRERVDERLRDERERVRGHVRDLCDEGGDVWVRGERVGEGRLADRVDATRGRGQNLKGRVRRREGQTRRAASCWSSRRGCRRAPLAEARLPTLSRASREVCC